MEYIGDNWTTNSPGASPTGVGGPGPHTFENRVVRPPPPPPDSRMKWPKSGVFFRILGYFGVGWPPRRRFEPRSKIRGDAPEIH